MADRAGDKPRRSASDKDRSRQLSRPISGKEAARQVGRSTRPQGRPQEGQRSGPDRRPQQQGGRTRQPQREPARQGGRRPQARRPAPGRPGQRRPAQRRPGQRPGRSRTALYTWGAIGLVLVVVAVVLAVSLSGGNKTKGVFYQPTPVSATVLRDITHVPASVYDTVGTGISGSINVPKVTSGQTPLKLDGKPGAFSLLGEFCPYCAAERWAIITAFSRFGTFSGLKTMQSSPPDVYPRTQTFTFNTTTYTSPYFSARLLEMYGQDKATGRHTVINKPTKSDLALISKYDHSSATSSGTIPFLDLGNKVFFSGASYNPGPLQGLSRSTIAASLSNPSSAVTKLIIGTANYISAAICSIDGGKPGSVCNSSGVQAAAKALKLSI